MTVSVILNRFLNELGRSGKSPNTLSAYATDLKQFVISLHEQSIDDVSLKDLLRFQQSIERSSLNTRARKLTTLRAFLRWCHRQGFTRDDLSKRITLPKRHAVRPTRPLTSSQISRLRREATPQERLLVELILQTGMRLRDVVALHPKHVSDRTVIIPSSGMELPLAGSLQKALARHQLIRPAKERTAILSNAHGRPISVRTATTILKNLGKRAGVRDATARTLRTTFIVRQLDAGMSFPTIQKITGFRTLGSLSPYQRLNAQQTQKSPVSTTEI